MSTSTSTSAMNGLIIGALLVGFCFVIFALYENRQKFIEACESGGGKPVFDGRQWQCIGASRKDK